MTPLQEQVVYLGAVFTASLQADRVAQTGYVDETVLECLLQSLLVVAPRNALSVYGSSDEHLVSGYKLMASLLQNNPSTARDPARYAMSLLMLERKLFARSDLMQTIGDRLALIQAKIEHFGLMHENVIAACGQLYEDTVSQCGKRIMVHGNPAILQKNGVPEKLRTILLTGIRAAMQWEYVGGRRWRLFFQRKKILVEVLERLNQLA